MGSMYYIMLLLSLLSGWLVGCLILKLLWSYQQSYHGPDSNTVKKQIYYDNQNRECYQYVPKPYICPTSAQLIAS